MFFSQKKIINKPLRILLVTNGLILIAGQMLGPIHAIFVEKIGGNLLDASLAGGLFALSAGITTLLSGYYCDRIKNKKMIMVLGYYIMGLGFFSYLFITKIWMLLMAQIIIGFGEAIYSPIFDALYSRNIHKKQAGKQWAAWESMYYFIAAIGAIIGGLIVTQFGFNTLFIIMGSLCFVSGSYLYLIPKKSI